MKKKAQLYHKNKCPQCGEGVLYFSADGLARTCEKCAYQEAVPPPRRYPHELLRSIETKSSGTYRTAVLAPTISSLPKSSNVKSPAYR